MHLCHLLRQLLGLLSSWAAGKLEALALERLLKATPAPWEGTVTWPLSFPIWWLLAICTHESGRRCYLQRGAPGGTWAMAVARGWGDDGPRTG